jgi:hypothetical protein
LFDFDVASRRRFVSWPTPIEERRQFFSTSPSRAGGSLVVRRGHPGHADLFLVPDDRSHLTAPLSAVGTAVRRYYSSSWSSRRFRRCVAPALGDGDQAAVGIVPVWD